LLQDRGEIEKSSKSHILLRVSVIYLIYITVLCDLKYKWQVFRNVGVYLPH